MQALEREVVGVVAGLAGGFRPAEQGGAQRVADFLLLHVEHLLGHFLPGEAQVADGGHGAQADGFPLREIERALVVVVSVMR